MAEPVVHVNKLPHCVFCKGSGKRSSASYDGATKDGGAWAFMCASHFDKFGLGLGTGIGTKLVLVR